MIHSLIDSQDLLRHRMGIARHLGRRVGRGHRAQPQVGLLVRIQPPNLLLHRGRAEISGHRGK